MCVVNYTMSKELFTGTHMERGTGFMQVRVCSEGKKQQRHRMEKEETSTYF